MGHLEVRISILREGNFYKLQFLYRLFDSCKLIQTFFSRVTSIVKKSEVMVIQFMLKIVKRFSGAFLSNFIMLK